MKIYLYFLGILFVSCSSGKLSKNELYIQRSQAYIEKIILARKRVRYMRHTFTKSIEDREIMTSISEEINKVDNALETVINLDTFENLINLQLDTMKTVKRKSLQLNEENRKLDNFLNDRQEFLDELNSFKTLLNNEHFKKRYSKNSKFKNSIDDMIKSFKSKIEDYRKIKEVRKNYL